MSPARPGSSTATHICSETDEATRRRPPRKRSLPFQSEWFFHYTVRITNERDETVQLLSRHWIIADETGHTEEVKGPGVVGEQPVLAPGESFQYTSGCQLRTSSGVMRGT